MEYRGSVYLRGQVWLVKESDSVTNWKMANTNVLAKTRPYVIMTADDILGESSVVMGFPLTTKIESPISSSEDDVILLTENDTMVRVVASQPTTFDLSQCLDYMYTVPNHVIQALEGALIKRSGIQNHLTSVQSSIEELKAKIQDGSMNPEDILAALNEMTDQTKAILSTGERTGLGRSLLNSKTLEDQTEPDEKPKTITTEETPADSEPAIEEPVEVEIEIAKDDQPTQVEPEPTPTKEEPVKEEQKQSSPAIKVAQIPGKNSKNSPRYVVGYDDMENLKVDDRVIIGVGTPKENTNADEDLSPRGMALRKAANVLGHDPILPIMGGRSNRTTKNWTEDIMRDYVKLRDGLSAGDMSLIYQISLKDVERYAKHCGNMLAKMGK